MSTKTYRLDDDELCRLIEVACVAIHELIGDRGEAYRALGRIVAYIGECEVPDPDPAPEDEP